MLRPRRRACHPGAFVVDCLLADVQRRRRIRTSVFTLVHDDNKDET